MNNLNKTKEELVKKLQELQKEYDALRESYERDIIERKKTEEKLLIINKAVESASDAIGISDAQGHHFYQNKALSDLFEYATTDELETAGGGKAVVKDPKVAKAMFGNIMSGKSWSGELEMVTKSGRVFPAYERADAIKDNDGNIIGLIGIITDITLHKRAEDALRESNAMYQAIFESTGAVTLIIDEDTTILMANNECYSVTGYTPAELIGQKWTQYVAPESLQKMLKNQLLRRENPDLAPKKYEVKMVNKKGELRNAIVDIGVIPNTKQGVVSILDITESKRVEEELRLSEEKYRTLFENMGDGVGFINEEEIFVYANQSAEKIFGVDEGGLTGLCINDFLVGESIELIQNETQKRRQGKSSVFEHQIVLKDGSKKDILATATPSFDNNKFIGTFAIFHSITERKQIEMALLQEQSLMIALMDTVPDHIYFKDHKSRFFRNNRAHVLSFGLSDPNQMVGKSDFDFFMKEVAQKQYEDEQEIIRTGQSINKEEFTIRNDNSVNWYYSTKMPLRDKNGIIIGTFGISRDITERKQAAEEIKRKNEELAKLNAEKDKFFSILAHDLRSPFNSLLGFTQIMVEELPTMRLDEVQKIALTMRKSATNLFGLLENLLEWSRMQRGMIPFDPAPILLLPSISSDMQSAMELANKKDITIYNTIPEGLIVFADKYMLGGIIRNLSFNAVKFTPKGGNVTISAKPIPDNWVEISIKDTGIGMSKTMIENLFRLDVNTSRKGTDGELSTGLGLNICKEFLKKHGGKLWVESEEGKGSTFYFTLPSQEDEPLKVEKAELS